MSGKNTTKESIAENQAEQALFEWANTFDSITDLVSIHDKNFKIVKANQAMATFLGMDRQDIIGKYCYEVMHGTDDFWPGCPHAEMLGTGDVTAREILDPKIGIPLQISCFPFYSKNKELIGSVHVARDISLQKQASEEKEQLIVALRATEEVLRESKERYHMLFERANDSIFAYNTAPDGMPSQFIEVNRKAIETLGYSKEELLSFSPQDLVAPDRWSEIPEIVEEKKKSGGDYIFETTLLCKDGCRIEVEISDHSFEVDTKPYTLSIVRDITDRKNAEAQLQIIHTELEDRVVERTAELKKTHQQLLHAEKLGAIGRLSSSIAHEVRNPLFSIMSVLEGVKLRASMDHEDAELVTLAIDECQRINALIQDLQNFNRPSSGKKIPTNINRLIEEIILLNVNELKKRNITLKKRLSSKVPPIAIIADQVKQVILNLLTNATDSCEEQDTITISTDASEDEITITIDDTGQGIGPENISCVFEPFFTTKPATKGTGLGLPISFGIIKSHGGAIDVQSTPNKHTKFTITLPITETNQCSGKDSSC